MDKIKPEWIPCKQGDVLPVGRHGIYVFNPSTGMGSILYENIGNLNPTVSYFYATHYCPINFPGPPKQ